MASVELDPLFLKAITLLRSKHSESAKQLNDLVQEYREKTYGSTNNFKKGNDNNDNGRNSPHISKVDSIKSNTPKHSPSPTNIKSQESKLPASPVHHAAGLSLMEKLEEITNFSDDNSNSSITPTIEESIEEINAGISLEPIRKKPRQSSSSSSSENIPKSDLKMSDNIPIDDIIEMDFDAPMCKVCHLNKRNEDGNVLVECSECHSHFHQRCHKPNVSTKDLNDPRLIWYCSRCTKEMKKEMAAQQQSSSTSNNKPSNETPAKVVSNPFQQAKPFRRNLGSVSDSSKSTIDLTNNKLTAASSNSSANEGSSKEVSLDGVSSKQRPANASPLKRLELVKKKRATKMQQILKQSRKQ